MFLGSGEWVGRWRRRLAQEPVRAGAPAHRQLAWRPTVADVVAAASEEFDVEPAEVLVSRRHGSEARPAALHLARRLADEAVGVIARQFGGVTTTAISKTIARVEDRRAGDRAWDGRLAKLWERLRTMGDAAKS
jgi:chromosomal replication initiation ATPase DnaA